jgi:hypothetical protein
MADVARRELAATAWRFYGPLLAIGAVVAAGFAAFVHMETSGHFVTGMDNQVVWGMPHVFAVFLIVAASGALNVASVASVFGRLEYKPLAPLSAIVAIALLAGGLAVLAADLGRPDRLVIAMTHFNFKSIFALNMFLYSGFFAIAGVYLWFMLERRMGAYGGAAGLAAFVWRLVLTTGTGSIFGFLVAREAYDSALLGPAFVVYSFAYGTAMFLVAMDLACRWHGAAPDAQVTAKLGRLLAIFAAASLYMTAALKPSFSWRAGSIQRSSGSGRSASVACCRSCCSTRGARAARVPACCGLPCSSRSGASRRCTSPSSARRRSRSRSSPAGRNRAASSTARSTPTRRACPRSCWARAAWRSPRRSSPWR